MLRQKGAVINQDGENALLASVESGNRECFAAMIEGQEEIILKKIRSHSLSYHAIQMKSNLLPLIASITEEQCQKQREIGSIDEESQFPPFDLTKKSDKKKFNTALSLQDHYVPYKEMNAELDQIKSIFTQIRDDQKVEKTDDQKSDLNNDYDLNDEYDNENSVNNTKNKNNDTKQNKQQNQTANSSAFLSQIPSNSEPTKESYESPSPEQNSKGKSKKLKKKLSKIEEIGINNNKILKLSQDQLNNQSNPTYQYLSSDDESENKSNLGNEFEIEEEEDEADNLNEEEANEVEEEIEYEFEEEEEVEGELGDNQNENYEYYSEYENQ